MINTNYKVRSRKLNNKIDLTAMVSVSFLLMIFFMVAAEMRKANVMHLTIPYNDESTNGWGCYKPDENRSYTILIGKNDKVVCYQGLIYFPIETPTTFNLKEKSLTTEIRIKNKQVLKYSASIGKPDRGINVIIKPSKDCNYSNLVAILDQMQINNIQSYNVINTFTPEEQLLLSKS
ncbi:MAG: biopolymer transporter ExbD [Flavobacteriaceae bacterium]|nr:biopolymer transporter ExbD [Bacteroidota bacterium]MBX9888780.1 biopolymer transporter ExbD [Flavobacteriaceae bacterium]